MLPSIGHRFQLFQAVDLCHHAVELSLPHVSVIFRPPDMLQYALPILHDDPPETVPAIDRTTVPPLKGCGTYGTLSVAPYHEAYQCVPKRTSNVFLAKLFNNLYFNQNWYTWYAPLQFVLLAYQPEKPVIFGHFALVEHAVHGPLPRLSFVGCVGLPVEVFA